MGWLCRLDLPFRDSAIMTRIASIVVILSAAVLFWPVRPWPARGAAVWIPQTQTAKEESLAIIVNQSNSVENVSTEELRKIFLGERSHWPNGRRITLVMMEPGQPERNAVLQDVCRLSESDLRRRYLQGLLTGEVLVSPKT